MLGAAFTTAASSICLKEVITEARARPVGITRAAAAAATASRSVVAVTTAVTTAVTAAVTASRFVVAVVVAVVVVSIGRGWRAVRFGLRVREINRPAGLALNGGVWTALVLFAATTGLDQRGAISAIRLLVALLFLTAISPWL